MRYLFSEDIQYVSTRKRKFNHKTLVILTVMLVLFIAFSAVSFVTIHQVFGEMFGRAEKPELTIYETYDDLSRDFSRVEVKFMSEEDELTGYIYGPSKNPKGMVVISHGIGGGADSYIQEATYFAKRGYKVLSFSNTGSHESEGKGTMGLSQSVIDLDAALDYVESQEEYEDLPVYLYGHSWGGYAVTAILNYDHEIAAAVSVAGYNSPMEMIMAWSKPQMGILSYVEYPYLWIYQKLLFGGASNLSAAEGINSTDTPVMIIHGTEDEVISYDGPSIMAHRDEITNPNAVFMTCSADKQNGHCTLYLAKSAVEYQAQLNAELEQLKAEYGGEENIPEDVLAGWYAAVDSKKASRLDEVFMQDAYKFFRDAVK
jgi:dienelactone hydrolase